MSEENKTSNLSEEKLERTKKDASEEKQKEKIKNDALTILKKEYPRLDKDDFNCYFCLNRTELYCPHQKKPLTTSDLENFVCEKYLPNI